MQFYTIHFTTKEIVTRYDKRGKPIEEFTIDHPQVMACLPHSTAMQFKDQDNFRIEQYELEQQRPGKHEQRRDLPVPKAAAAAPKTRKFAGTRRTAVQTAAASGDLAAAVSGEQ